MNGSLRAVQDGAVRERSAEAVRLARTAQPGWARRDLRQRLRVVRGCRDALARGAGELAALVVDSLRQTNDVLASEVLPLADACRFLERHAEHILAPELAAGGGPLWLGRSRVLKRRVPLGVILVVGPGNYPLLLPGVQILQALAAGNAVVVKPAAGGRPVMMRLREMLVGAGLPPAALTVLEEDVDAVRGAVEARVDKVLLTGSAATGRAVLGLLAEQLTPAVMELSGCDAAFVLPGADPGMAARALRFGMTLNGGRTCIAPRRVFVAAAQGAELEAALAGELAAAVPVGLQEATRREVESLIDDAHRRGARVIGGFAPDGRSLQPTLVIGADPGMRALAADVFAPVLTMVAVADMDEALERDRQCPYALGASIFGPDEAARQLAVRVRAGVVVINDMIVPTADPRVPFGGGGDSGFGVTRGAEGLLELTRSHVVIRRPGRFRPHFDPPPAGLRSLLEGVLQASHARSWRQRITGARSLLRAALSGRSGGSEPSGN